MWWLILIVTAALAGMIAALFLPPTIKGSLEPFLRIATAVLTTVILGMWWLSTRLRRTDVGRIEKFARRIFFKKAH